MLKQTRASYFSNFKNAQYCALSSDPIPDYVKNGDEVYIIDTAKRCLYDADSGTLIEQPSSGGGGSSDWTNASVTFINNTPENGEYFVDTPFGVIPIEEQETIVLPLKKEDGSIFYLSLKDIVDVESSVAPSVTGNITIEENGFEIQGDGSIAFSSLAPTEISGVPPLELDDALARPLRKLVQHGKVAVSGTDVVCNNGTLKFGATGKNLFKVEESEMLSQGWNRYFPIQLKAGDYTMSCQNGLIIGGVSRSARVQLADASKQSIRSISNGYNYGGSEKELSFTITAEEEETVALICFEPTSANTTFSEIAAMLNMIEKGDQATSYEPYTEGIYADGTPEEIRLNGINQWDEEWEVGNIDTTTGQNIDDADRIRSVNYIPVLPSTDYYFVNNSEKIYSLRYYDADKNYINNSAGATSSAVYQTSSNCYFIRFIVVETTYNNDISINYPSTDTDYHPAHIQTATAENLFAVDDIEDTQDIVTGEVIHRTEAIVSDGTTPSGRYVGTVGEGNVIVRVREDKYEGEVVSFEAEEEFPLNKLVVSLSPQQDLHGYDNPWPAGGGVNKLPPAASFAPVTVGDATLTPYPDGHYHVSKVAGTSPSSIDIYLEQPVSVTTSQYIRYISNADSGNMVANLRNSSGVVNGGYWGKPSANIANDGTATYFNFYFTAGVYGEYDLWPIISDSPVSAYSPYSNICPISGWTGVSVYVNNGNQWDGEWEEGSIDGSTGQNESASGFWRTKNYIPIKPDITYYVACSVTGSMRGRFYDKDKNYLGTSDKEGADLATNRTFTAPSNACFVRFAPNGSVLTTKEISVNYPSTDTEYHAYNGNSYSVTFPSVNVWDEEWETGTIVDGVKENASNRIRTKNYIPVRPNTKYCFYDRLCFFEYGVDKTYISNTGFIGTNAPSPTSDTFITGNSTYYLMFITTTTYGTTYGNNLFINYPSIVTDYHAYGEPMPVYGGEPDIVSGEMPINQVVIDDYTNLYVGYNTEVGIIRSFYLLLPDTITRKADTFVQSNLFKSQPLSGDHAYDCEVTTITHLINRIYFSISNVDYPDITAGEAKQFLIDNNVQFCINLATPIPTTITPNPMSVLEGENNIWSNAGTVSAYVSEGDLVEQVTPQPLITAEGDNTLIVTAEVDDIVFDVAYRKNNSGGETLPDARGVYF